MLDTNSYLASLGPLELIGVAGFFAYISAFASVQIGQMDGNGIAYSLLNILAATLVGIGLLAEFNLSSALIQGSWIIIGLTGLVLRLIKSPSAQTTPISHTNSIGASS